MSPSRRTVGCLSISTQSAYSASSTKVLLMFPIPLYMENICLDFIESGGAFYGRGVPLCISGVLNTLEENVQWDEGVILSSD